MNAVSAAAEIENRVALTGCDGSPLVPSRVPVENDFFFALSLERFKKIKKKECFLGKEELVSDGPREPRCPRPGHPRVPGALRTFVAHLHSEPRGAGDVVVPTLQSRRQGPLRARSNGGHGVGRGVQALPA